jgi:2-dehydro-3-deoxy-D-arabinonate dehydratase
MRLARIRLPSGGSTIGLLEESHVIPAPASSHYQTLTDIFETEDPRDTALFLFSDRSASISVDEVRLLAPLDQHEVWAAGVTYRRSRSARMEESEDAETFYDKVYGADRPELFFKASPHRVAGPDQAVRIRQDAVWNVPEPELALVLDSRLRLVGFTIGNDMSSRDIEGENPLYLPQAKIYDQSCALGPSITLVDAMPPAEEIGISLVVRRKLVPVFEGQTSISHMARSFDNLIEYLGRDNTFPQGVILLTGTGIVPDREFTLQPGDKIEIAIDGIGTLSNHVIQG